MAKNEKEAMPSVTDYSSNLSSIEKNVRGLDIFAMKKNEKIEFQITKHNFEIFSISASECDGNIILEQTNKNERELANLDKHNLSKNLSKTIKQYAEEHDLKIKKNSYGGY